MSEFEPEPTTEFTDEAGESDQPEVRRPRITILPPKGEQAEPPAYRGATSDPLFGFVLAAAVSIGMTPLPTEYFDLRYTVAWLALATVSILGWLLGSSERIGQERPENIAWGIGFGILLGAPMLAFGAPILAKAANLMFAAMTPGTLLAYLIFVMPLAETLFFRGVLQSRYEFWIVGAWSTVWGVILFFPPMWGDILQFPAVGFFIAIVLLMINSLYSYVKERNGLAAAWICQIVVNLMVVFIPFTLIS
jgi:membrane protease YdiL (CAAX protease family)